MKIDFHSHFIDRGHLDALQRRLDLKPESSADGKTIWRHNGVLLVWSRPDMFDIENTIAEMDRKQIDMRVLTITPPHVNPWRGQEQIDLSRRFNDRLAKICRAYPDRFVGLACLPFDDIDASVKELRRCVEELGLKGVTIGSNVEQAPLSDPRYEPLWQALDRLQVPVLEHPMIDTDQAEIDEFELPLRLGMIFETTMIAARLIYSGVFERYPNFPYVLAHTGGALLLLLDRLDNGYRLFPACRKYITRPPSEFAKQLYYDTCSFSERSLMLAKDVVGTEQLLFATDAPYLDVDSTHVDTLPITESERAAILGGNAARILKL